jgi:tRNA U34 5-carboxymethylaminomethyl modifying enzyme MnmG/GidA
MTIPRDVEYSQEAFPALSGEELEKLRLHRPETLHHASLLEGMTSAGLVYLHHFVKRTHGQAFAHASGGGAGRKVPEEVQEQEPPVG